MVMSDKIKPYSVMVKWNKKLAGSGVLVKSKDNKCYLFTARHLFKRDGITSFKGVKEAHIKEDLDSKNIFICKENFKNDIRVKELLYFREDLDLVVFSLKEEPPIQHLPIVKILKNDHQTQNYYFYGYPDGSNNTGHLANGKYIQSNEEENHVFRLSAKNNFDGDEISGYSGSGIFVESEEKIEIDDNEPIKNSIIYLVGLLIRAEDKLSYYEGVDLSEIIDDINHKTNTGIPTIEDALDTQFTQQIKTKILKRNQDDNFIQQIKKINQDNKILLKEFLDNSENELSEMTKKLADYYLLGGMSYKDMGEESSAKKYFRLATKFNPRYKRYEKGYKGKNIEIEKSIEEQKEEIINYYHNGIIAFHNNNNNEAEQAFLEHLKKENIEDFEKLESYKYLSKIYENKKDYLKAIEYSKKALEKATNIFEKVEICYRLSNLCIDGEDIDALGYIEKGLGLIENKDDEISLGLKLKLEDLRDKLEKKDNDKIINPTLIQLVKLNPEKYMDKFLKEYLKTQNGEITPTIIYQKLEDLHRDIKGIKEKKD